MSLRITPVLILACALWPLAAAPVHAQLDTLAGNPFISAVNRGNPTDVEEMIVAGDPVNQKDSYGRSAVLLSAMDNHCAVTIVLLKHGAATELKDQDGRTALMWAADHGYIACVDALLAARADVNAIDKQGITALMRAAAAGRADVVAALIKAKADVNATDYAGLGVLGYAEHARQKKIAEMLKAAGAHL